MAKYKIQSIEERSDGDVACDCFVLKDDDTQIGHFAVILDADDILALAGLPKAERIAGYKALFASDPRIAGTVDSESAKAQIEADVSFPVTVSL